MSTTISSVQMYLRVMCWDRWLSNYNNMYIVPTYEFYRCKSIYVDKKSHISLNFLFLPENPPFLLSNLLSFSIFQNTIRLSLELNYAFPVTVSR